VSPFTTERSELTRNRLTEHQFETVDPNPEPNGSQYIPSATGPRNNIFPTYFMDVDKPAIPRLRPFRVAAMPYFDVPNCSAPRLDFGYTEEQLAHCIRVIASVSHPTLSDIPHENRIPHSAAQDAGSLLDAKLMCRSARMSQSTAPRHTGTLVL
jgi:hypothetical protein